ncbi:MAG: glucosyl-3-phosphoglycerate synthase [Actinomycetota bacterium]|nr:glucosyl-3-phosphoglycerate synthase [Actinomycetota bacterium]
MIRTFHHEAFEAEALAERKAAGGHVVSVCLPARNEAATVGGIVAHLRRELVDGVGLVDEVLVMDDHSTDATAEVAAAAGATVVAVDDVLPELGPGTGKGEALYKSVAAAEGDLIVWCDADITDFGPRFVVGLLGPLLTSSDLHFVKGYYDRPVAGSAHGGGRVTELVARPTIAMLFPHLSSIVQPLSGEYAGRRSLLERLPFVQGYGVDLGLLIDITQLEGTGGLAQVDLGTRRHRNRPLDELGPQALAVLQTALGRAGTGYGDTAATLIRPDLDPVEVSIAERPPLLEVAGYERRSA